MVKSRIKNRCLLFIIPLFILTFIVLVGCSDNTTNNALSQITANMTSIQKTIETMNNIDNSSLIICDFMDDSNVSLIGNIVVSNNKAIDDYFTRIVNLNNSIVDTMSVNDSVKIMESSINSKAQQIKDYCKQLKRNKYRFDNKRINALYEVNSSISTYLTRLKLTKNEVKNNLTNVENMKGTFSSNTDVLTTRYKKLYGSLLTRLTNYNCVSDNLEQILQILYPANINNDDLETSEINNETDDEKEVSLRVKKNIDTYENAGKRYRDFNDYNYNNDYIYNNPGIYGGFGFQMPYGYGFRFPNINTYRGFRNIDTYRNREQKERIVETEKQSDDEETFVGNEEDKPRIEKLKDYYILFVI